jgi:ABC-type transport system involved in cytochrome c biogenesis permease subunit
MTPDQLADLSRVLYSPVTLALYLGSAFVYLYALTTTVGRREERERGRIAQRVGALLAIAGIGTHVAHEIVRGLAQSRFPLGNMFEVSSLMALVGVVVGFTYLTFIRKRAELNGFVMLGGALVLASALLMYAEPGPLMPILDTWWRHFHVSLLVGAMGIFAAGLVFNGLYLLRDTGERAVARSRERQMRGSTVGAAYVGDLEADDELEETAALADRTTDTLDPSGDDGRDHDAEYRDALRKGISPGRLAIGTFLVTSLVSWVFIYAADSIGAGLGRFLTINLVMVGAALLARWFVPFLPSTATLDGLAHRTIAFGFLMWTVGTIAGAMWAEQSWGRFWGWDPKETGAFLTWIAYAGYLHARATTGMKGRRAAWIGVGAFVILMGTYLIANYVIVGLHSYAGL